MVLSPVLKYVFIGIITSMVVIAITVTAIFLSTTSVKSESLKSPEYMDIEQIEEEILVSWTKPVNSHDYPGQLTYKIYYKENTGIEFVEETAELYCRFNTSTCAIATITVIPITSTGLEGHSISMQHKTGPGKVSDINIRQTNQLLCLNWKPPPNSEACGAMTYRILYMEKEILMSINSSKTSVDITITSSCTKVNITITSINENNVLGLSAYKEHLIGIGPVRDVNVYQDEMFIHVEWVPPVGIESCGPINYGVIYLERGKEISQEKIDTEKVQFEILSKPCTSIDIEIISTNELGTLSEKTIKPYTIKMGRVQNIRLTQINRELLVKWDKPEDTGNCNNIRYNVSYNQAENKTIYEEPSATFNLTSSPCTTTTIDIMPFNDLVDGVSTRKHHVVDIGQVKNVMIIQTDKILVVTWDIPDNIEFCGSVSYEVLYQELEEIIDSEETTGTEISFELKSEACKNIKFTITPISEIKAQAYTEKYIVKIGSVQNIEVTQKDFNITVSWKPPPLGICIGLLEYKTVLYSGTNDTIEEQNIASTNVNFELNLMPCAVINIEISAFNSVVQGVLKNKTTRFEIGQVQSPNVTQQKGNVTVRWENPANIGNCKSMMYNIDYEENGKFSEKTSDNEVTFQIWSRPDSIVRFNITPSAIDTQGQSCIIPYTIKSPEDTKENAKYSLIPRYLKNK